MLELLEEGSSSKRVAFVLAVSSCVGECVRLKCVAACHLALGFSPLPVPLRVSQKRTTSSAVSQPPEESVVWRERSAMASQMKLSGLLLLILGLPAAESTMLTDPRLCYILDGFLGLYGLIITGMFIKEKFFRTKVKISDENIYNDPRVTATTHRDPEQGRQRRKQEEIYTPLKDQDGGEYKEIRRKERPRKNDQVYQDLSAASRDTYDALHMQPLTAR
ncbi:hypothetical protein OJAV_G00013790 [Oryzias javanicus]|uniref:T-cell surface glycoprotein CD3 zeta chain n=1 Tax=Oryzias javanicus TaxID=123683 RepID=A0A3S2PJE2_ORYJA|nr:hypothetical protein OJAV_G00013790 [Oryzias javanicus]